MMKKRQLTLFLHGGDGALEHVLERLAATLEATSKPQVWSGLRVGYVVVALAHLDPTEIEQAFSKTIAPLFLEKKGVASLKLITEANLDEMYGCDFVILSGGNTTHLLKTLSAHKVAERLRLSPHCIRFLAGISAGAIALASEGIGRSEDKDIAYKGLGLFHGAVIPHADTRPPLTVFTSPPEAVHLGSAVFTTRVSLGVN